MRTTFRLTTLAATALMAVAFTAGAATPTANAPVTAAPATASANADANATAPRAKLMTEYGSSKTVAAKHKDCKDANGKAIKCSSEKKH